MTFQENWKQQTSLHIFRTYFSVFLMLFEKFVDK